MRGRAVALVVGLVGVVVSALLWTLVSYNDAFAYRGGFLLAALATTAVLFSVVTSQRSVLARCLSVAPLRYVGRISYGMYLWHFPLFIYIDNARTGLTGYPLFAVRVAATLAVATASFYADRTADPTGEPPARLAGVGPHACGRGGDGGRARGGDQRSRGGGPGPAASANLRLRHGSRGQGTRGRRLHRAHPRHRPQRARP